MTTIAYREGIIAADSGLTYEDSAAGTRKGHCCKLYRKFVSLQLPGHTGVEIQDVLIALQGESTPGLLFLRDIFGHKGPNDEQELRDNLIEGEADFAAFVLTRNGLFEYDRWVVAEEVIEPFWSLGSGSKAALGAMWSGATAVEAVKIAKIVDPYTFGKVVSARLLPPDTDFQSDILSKDVARGFVEITEETA